MEPVGGSRGLDVELVFSLFTETIFRFVYIVHDLFSLETLSITIPGPYFYVSEPFSRWAEPGLANLPTNQIVLEQ